MKRCRLALAALALGLLTACAGGRGAGPAVAHYDLGSPRPVAGAGFPLRAFEVQAAAWLGTPAMQYRLAYADAGRREAYAQSRWASPPPPPTGVPSCTSAWARSPTARSTKR